MMSSRKVIVLVMTAAVSAGLLFFELASTRTYAQQGPLTYPEVITALQSKLPNSVFRNKTELVAWVITQIKRRKMDKPLTRDREDDLRQAGATNELVEVIRTNSPALPTPTPTPVPVINLGELAGRAINLIRPEYTPEARQAGTAGEVKLALELDEAGNVTSVTRLTVLPNGLTERAIEAARQSKFKPAVLNGKPARGSGTLTFNFKINAINVAAVLAQAEDYRNNSNCDRAIPEYTKVIGVDAKNQKALFGRGLCSLVKANYDGALKDFDSVVSDNPTDSDAAFYLAVAYDFKGEPKTAATYYERTVSLRQGIGRQPMMQCLYIDRGQTLEETRGYANRIIDACTRALQRAPETLTGLIYMKRGIGYRVKSEYDNAISDFETARRINPQFTAVLSHLHAAYNSRGLINFGKKQFDAAFDDVTKAINIDPQSATPYVNRCVIYLYARKDFDKAVEDCSTAIRLSGKSSMAYNHRGYAYEMKNYRKEAIADYTRALEIDPQNQTARTNLNRLQPEKPSIKY